MVDIAIVNGDYFIVYKPTNTGSSGLEPWAFMTFHMNWEENIIPTDELTPSFFRGLGEKPTTKQWDGGGETWASRASLTAEAPSDCQSSMETEKFRLNTVDVTDQTWWFHIFTIWL